MRASLFSAFSLPLSLSLSLLRARALAFLLSSRRRAPTSVAAARELFVQNGRRGYPARRVALLNPIIVGLDAQR